LAVANKGKQGHLSFHLLLRTCLVFQLVFLPKGKKFQQGFEKKSMRHSDEIELLHFSARFVSEKQKFPYVISS
jgi:hypothetical protein